MYGPATIVEEVKDSNTPCCNGTCPEGTKKFYSVDHGMGHQPFCGETCLDPKKYKLYHLFEKNLTKATEYPTHPCMHQFDTKGGHYSVYTKTVTHCTRIAFSHLGFMGGRPINVSRIQR